MDPNDAFHPAMNPINADTLANFLKSKPLCPVYIIDCRFDYEFQAGHIIGAYNMGDPAAIESFFMQNANTLRDMMRSRAVLIFHCEFSERRGPNCWRELRNADRSTNARRISDSDSQQLFFPEMYLLEKGYAHFH